MNFRGILIRMIMWYFNMFFSTLSQSLWEFCTIMEVNEHSKMDMQSISKISSVSLNYTLQFYFRKKTQEAPSRDLDYFSKKLSFHCDKIWKHRLNKTFYFFCLSSKRHHTWIIFSARIFKNFLFFLKHFGIQKKCKVLIQPSLLNKTEKFRSG